MCFNFENCISFILVTQMVSLDQNSEFWTSCSLLWELIFMKLRLALMEIATVVQAQLKKMSAFQKPQQNRKIFFHQLRGFKKTVCRLTYFHHNYFFQLVLLHLPSMKSLGMHTKLCNQSPSLLLNFTIKRIQRKNTKISFITQD